jgi:hypothetical protein
LDRIVYVDARYYWIHKRFAGHGGNNTLRTITRHNQEIDLICNRWGRYLSVKQAKQATMLVLHVVR